jgi:hypothetical protein
LHETTGLLKIRRILAENQPGRKKKELSSNVRASTPSQKKRTGWKEMNQLDSTWKKIENRK